MEKISEALAYWLRHKPDAIGITLDEEGWTDLEELSSKSGFTINDIKHAVRVCEKQRYTIVDGRIRANQGHSIALDMTFKEVEPPVVLYHGTPNKFLEVIALEGLKPMARHHVHLSMDLKTAREVGNRRGKSRILSIAAQQMYKDGVKFYISDNGVYLVDAVDVKYIVGVN